MASLESIFIRELKSAITLQGSKDIYSIPLPSTYDWVIDGREALAIKGIEDEYYSKLNGKTVYRVPNSQVGKRIIDPVTRDFKKDENGVYIMQPYVIPKSCYVIASSEVLGLPFKYSSKFGNFDYVDFVTSSSGKTEFLYAIPTKYLYKINQVALALSVKSMKNYQGMGYTTWDKGVIFLHIIPYNPNCNYTGTRILFVGTSLNMSDRIKSIVDYWQEIELIPTVSLCYTEMGENLILKQTSIGYDSYEPLDLVSIGDREFYGSDSEASQV